MPRTLDPEAHAVRRDAFVDVAQGLIQTKGYEQLSIQDVLDEVGASKGAFYHYFDSKVGLLEAVVERMVVAATAEMEPIVADPNRTAVQKLNDVFSTLAQWKSDRRALVVALIEVWISDDNAIVREKLRKGTVAHVTPLLATIVRQGVEEGTFHTDSPAATARVLVSLIQGASDVATDLVIARKSGAISFDVVERTLTAYTSAYERVLGLPAGSWSMMDEATLHSWFD
jgi:AcrR family transcriptional regulator